VAKVSDSFPDRDIPRRNKFAGTRQIDSRLYAHRQPKTIKIQAILSITDLTSEKTNRGFITKFNIFMSK
jgi:hypothetical protein